MAFESNIIPKILGMYDEELLLSHFEPNNSGKYMARDTLANMHHSGGAPEYHPTIPNVIKNTNGHVFVNGSFEFEWEWEPGSISESDVDSYLNLFYSENINPHFTITKKFNENKLVGNLSVPNDVISNWTSNYIKWHIAAPKAKCTFTSNESEIVCVTRLNGSFSQYSFDQKTVESGETIEIRKPDCTTCYLLFTDHVVKTGTSTVLMKINLYKLVNQSIFITNVNESRVRVLRYYK